MSINYMYYCMYYVFPNMYVTYDFDFKKNLGREIQCFREEDSDQHPSNASRICSTKTANMYLYERL